MDYEVFSCSDFSISMIKEIVEAGSKPKYEILNGVMFRNRVSENLEEIMYLTKKEKI